MKRTKKHNKKQTVQPLSKIIEQIPLFKDALIIFERDLSKLTTDPDSPWHIDRISRNICKQFLNKFDMSKNDLGQRTAYKWIFDRIGVIPRWYNLVCGRCDDGECSLGDFALRLLDNQEMVNFSKWWKQCGHRDFQARHPGINLGYKYNGVEKFPCVLFYPGDRSQPDFCLFDLDTDKTLRLIEFKDRAKTGQATYKKADLYGYSKAGILVSIVTIFYDKAGKPEYYSIIDDIEGLLSNRLKEDGSENELCYWDCPWIGHEATVLRDYEAEVIYEGFDEDDKYIRIPFMARSFRQFCDIQNYATGQILDQNYNPKDYQKG